MEGQEHEAMSPGREAGSSANDQHLFESALFVDPSHTSATTPPPPSQDAEPSITSDATPAEAASSSAQVPDAQAESRPARQTRPNHNGIQRDPKEPRHCWICLTDEGVDSTSSDWRSPCPCALTAHEDCLLQWISEMESTARKEGSNTHQKITCPQCKNEIKVQRPTEFLVLLQELLAAIGRQIMLPAGVMMLGGVVYSGSMVYGFNVLELVFGPDGGRCLVSGIPPPLGGSSSLISRSPKVVKALFEGLEKVFALMSPFAPKHKDSWLFWLSPWIMPTLLISRTGFGDRVLGAMSLPSLMVLSYNTLTDPRNTPLFQWPPTPGIALLSLPYIRSIYNTAYASLFAVHEKRWRQAIQRHPREGETAEEIAANAEAEGMAVGDHVLGIEIELVEEDEMAREIAEAARRARELRIQVEELRALQRGEAPVREIMPDEMARDIYEAARQARELRIQLEEQVAIQRGEAPVHEIRPDEAGDNAVGGIRVDGGEQDGQAAAEIPQQPAQAQVPAPAADAQANAEPAAPPAAAPAAVAPAQANAWEFRQNVSVFSLARTVVATLLFPAASSITGDALALLLPKTWVVPPSIPLSTGGFLAGLLSWGGWSSGRSANLAAGTWKRGLLQEKWGRTIVGGMIVVGVKDAVSLYVLWRRAKIEGSRRVLDYDAWKGLREGRENRVREREARAGGRAAGGWDQGRWEGLAERRDARDAELQAQAQAERGAAEEAEAQAQA